MRLRRRSLLGLSAAALATPALAHHTVRAQEATPPGGESTTLTLYLVTLQGTFVPATVEEARVVHNESVGVPEIVEASRALGDVSHLVFVPITPPASGAGDVLIYDIWSSAEGLGQFFADPRVQEQAAKIFTNAEPIVWAPADGFSTYHLLPAPGKNDRFVVMVRGTVASREETRTLHNAVVASQVGAAHFAGDLSHEAYFRVAAPDAPESFEFLALDVWNSAEGLQAYYAQPEFQSVFAGSFTAPPAFSVWTPAPGDWTVW